MSDITQNAVGFIRSQTSFMPEVGVVLGSGLGPLAEQVDVAFRCCTSEIPGYPPSTVEGHEGEFILGTIGSRNVVLLKGRIHSYEGYSLSEVTLPIRMMALMGVHSLILTNSAGGIREGFQPGNIMVIEDHLNLQGQSPLFGPNEDSWGPRFPDMSVVYDAELRASATRLAPSHDLDLVHGVYASLPGPQYETPAEVRMIQTLGADAVGMSTVPEAIVARHMGLRVLGLSLISNAAAGLGEAQLSHEEVMEAGATAATAFSGFLQAILQEMNHDT